MNRGTKSIYFLTLVLNGNHIADVIPTGSEIASHCDDDDDDHAGDRYKIANETETSALFPSCHLSSQKSCPVPCGLQRRREVLLRPWQSCCCRVCYRRRHRRRRLLGRRLDLAPHLGLYLDLRNGHRLDRSIAEQKVGGGLVEVVLSCSILLLRLVRLLVGARGLMNNGRLVVLVVGNRLVVGDVADSRLVDNPLVDTLPVDILLVGNRLVDALPEDSLPGEDHSGNDHQCYYNSHSSLIRKVEIRCDLSSYCRIGHVLLFI